MSVVGVFIAGHGRMVRGAATETVPDKMSMGWAVPAGNASCGLVSRNMIAGRNGVLTDVANAGERYNQHWLVPDGPENMIIKAKDLVNSMGGKKKGYEGSHVLPASTYWLLQPRANNAVTLSAILAYLRKVIPGTDQIDVMWTCCRSPIGTRGLWRSEIHSPFEAYTTVGTSSTEDVSDPETNGEGFKLNKHTCADGTVTLVQASDTSKMLNWGTWIGLKTGIAPAGELPVGNLVGEAMVGRKLPD